MEICNCPVAVDQTLFYGKCFVPRAMNTMEWATLASTISPAAPNNKSIARGAGSIILLAGSILQ
jgi:hypothetical protein